MVFTLYKDGSSLKTSLLDVYNCLCYPLGRTLRPSWCGVSGGGGGGGGHFFLVGDSLPWCIMSGGNILHGGTIRPPTPVLYYLVVLNRSAPLPPCSSMRFRGRCFRVCLIIHSKYSNSIHRSTSLSPASHVTTLYVVN